MNLNLERWSDWLLKAFLSILVVLSVVAPFVVPIDGYDRVSHLIWIKSFAALLHQGILIPRWLPESFGGLGAPTFYFYPPLAYYLSSAISFILPSATPSTLYHIAGVIGTWSSFLTFRYLLLRLGVSPKHTIIASLLFAVGPFHYFNLYIRNGFGDHLGTVFLPLFFAGLIGTLKDDWRTRDVLLLTMSWSAIILSNIPLAFVTALGALPVVWFMREGRTPIIGIIRAGLGIALGTVTVSYFLFPIAHFKP